MKKYSADELNRAWGVFMVLCEEFTELYDKYVEKVEKDLETYRAKIEIEVEEKKLTMDKIWELIKREDRD